MLMSVGPVTGLQVTAPVSPPQHSPLLVQRLFRILQPRPGWQTLTPVWAQGPQTLLQQFPQAPLQIVPSCAQLPVPVVPGLWQVPWVAPAVREQKPLQQSLSRPHTSPGWMHHEEPRTHLPPLQRPEQQLPAPPSPAPQGLPAVAQELLSGVQVPFVQVPLQQPAEAVQAWLSAMQLVAVAQLWLLHWRLQQSVLIPQAAPAGAQVVTDEVQVCVAESQANVQHSVAVVQAEPPTLQVTTVPPVPVVPL